MVMVTDYPLSASDHALLKRAIQHCAWPRPGWMDRDELHQLDATVERLTPLVKPEPVKAA